ncbi:MAG: crosslink repair DNA glycosylase YcaQ family protein [Bacteroidota bacterium]
MSHQTLSLKAARRLILECQGLLKYNPYGKNKRGTAKAVDSLGYVQIDTISVVSRAHHHTLWARVPGYQPKMLFSHQATDRTVFEYWSHAAAYLPMHDFRFSLPRKLSYKNGRKHWYDVDKKVNQYVYERLKAEGPLMSKDFETPKGTSGIWYNFKPAKIALNQLFMQGDIMISERRGFQKVFDLTERVVPSGIETTLPNEFEMACHLIERGIQTQGLIRDKEVSYLRKGMGAVVRNAIKKLVDRGQLIVINFKELPGETFYSNAATLTRTPTRIGKKLLHILCPFDNILIQRQRAIDFFNFDYKIECYVPEPKRVKGYFSLPVLFGDQFIGQFDAKSDRKMQVFVIKQFHLEEGVKDWEEFLPTLVEKLWEYAQFCGCKTILVEQTFPREFREVLIKGIR